MAIGRRPTLSQLQSKRNNCMELHQNIMQVVKCLPAVTTFPTGDKSFAVQQGFPQPISAEEADPFLMCDHFVRAPSLFCAARLHVFVSWHVMFALALQGPSPQPKRSWGEDEFPVGWHPHRGMDILTYIVQGQGRHADSLGNRCTFDSPGMQWIRWR
jgi:hypothetical protein